MRPRSVRFVHMLLFAVTAFALTLAGCGKATKDSAESRFRGARDKLQAVTAKNPATKMAVDEQMKTFDKDFEIAKAKTPDEEAIKAMSEVAGRVEKYEADLSKTMAPPAGAPPAGAAAAPPVGGKLGGTAQPPAVAPAGMPGGGMPGAGMPGAGMPGGGMPGGGMPGGKLGGGAPPPAPAAAPQGGSGFGGQ